MPVTITGTGEVDPIVLPTLSRRPWQAYSDGTKVLSFVEIGIDESTCRPINANRTTTIRIGTGFRNGYSSFGEEISQPW